ncbi:MAG: hypothetical protein WC211_01375 [Dehalococcoidia bacterium]
MQRDDWGSVLQPADITAAFVDEFYGQAIDGWYEDGPIDWEDAIERWERYHRAEGVTFGSQWDGPAILRLKRLVRAHRRENGLG